jgi:hypothetical protein
MNPDERDSEIAAMWRAASRDEPPAALDDAIRAAARRAVGAGPSRARHMRTWPLAAAAVMAVFAIGLLQLTPPEQVTPGMDTDGLPVRQMAKNAASPMGAGSGVAGDSATSNPPVTVAANGDRAVSASSKPDAAVAAATSPSASGPVPAPATAFAPAPADEREAGLMRKKLAQPPAAAPSTTRELQGAARMRDQSAGVTANATTEPLRELDAKAKLEGGAAQAEVQTAAKAQRAEPFPATPSQDKVAGAATLPAAPPPAMSVPAPAAAPAPAPRALVDAPPVLSATNRRAPTEATGAMSARRDVAPAAMPQKLAKDSPPRPADEWIKSIRKLQSEGRNEEVAKELTAFRAAYKERADALLPADLRAIKP